MKKEIITKNTQNTKLHKNCKSVKKATSVLVTVLMIMAFATVTVFGASGTVDTTEFISKTVTVLKSVVSLIGGGLAIFGVVNLIEGYGNDNAGAKSQGIKQTMAGLGLILLAAFVIPVLGTMMTGAM